MISFSLEVVEYAWIPLLSLLLCNSEILLIKTEDFGYSSSTLVFSGRKCLLQFPVEC